MREFDRLLARYLPDFAIRPATEEDGDLLLALSLGNTYYFTHTQSHAPTRAECLEDITALPPGTEPEQKSYLLLFRGERCAAVMDFVRGYPDGETGFLGLLMLSAKLHGQGLGRQIVAGVLAAAGALGLRRVALGCFEENQAGLAFWTKMGFVPYSRTQRQVDGRSHTVLRMERPVAHG